MLYAILCIVNAYIVHLSIPCIMTEYKAPSIIAIVAVIGSFTLTAIDPFVEGSFNYGFMSQLVAICVIGPAAYITGRETIKRWRGVGDQ